VNQVTRKSECRISENLETRKGQNLCAGCLDFRQLMDALIAVIFASSNF
jgi:hypothetical protein